MTDMTLRNPLGRVRGLGSAKFGAEHHWATNITAIGLIPLSLWFVISIIGLVGADYDTFRSWVSQPLNASLLILTLVLVIHHAQMGVQMVVEDYVSCEVKKTVSVIVMKLVAAFLAIFMTVSTIKVAIGG